MEHGLQATRMEATNEFVASLSTMFTQGGSWRRKNLGVEVNELQVCAAWRDLLLA